MVLNYCMLRSAQNLPLMYPEKKRSMSITHKRFIHLHAVEARNPIWPAVCGESKWTMISREREREWGNSFQVISWSLIEVFYSGILTVGMCCTPGQLSLGNLSLLGTVLLCEVIDGGISSLSINLAHSQGVSYLAATFSDIFWESCHQTLIKQSCKISLAWTFSSKLRW